MTAGVVSQSGADWRRAVEPYVGPAARRSTFQLISTLGLLSLSILAAHFALGWWWPAALLIAPITAGMLVRTFIIMHDCAHASFLANKRWNELVGYVTGVLTFTPFEQWRRDHALHHASSGDLDRRGHGDIPTLTVREYLAKSERDRRMYRLVRHPAALLLGGPIHLIINQRFRTRSRATGTKQINSVWATNAGIAVVLLVGVFALGWKSLLLSYLFPFYLAAMAGVWLFYVQHQFEDAYWAQHGEWDYVEAALKGSSHLKLTPILRWFTGSIGLHHVHHVAPRIPNYHLQRCHDENELFHASPTITLRSGMSALRLSLWDEDNHRLIGFRDLAKS